MSSISSRRLSRSSFSFLPFLASSPLPAPDWREDYPIEVRLSPPANTWYGATRAQAFEGIAARLMGDTTHESWTFSKMFFARAGQEGAEAVVQGQNGATS